MLDGLHGVGLGYISLSQLVSTLSGGERQRLKLAIDMANSTETYVLDEPTTDPHMHDADNLIVLLCRLVDRGRTVGPSAGAGGDVTRDRWRGSPARPGESAHRAACRRRALQPRHVP